MTNPITHSEALKRAALFLGNETFFPGSINVYLTLVNMCAETIEQAAKEAYESGKSEIERQWFPFSEIFPEARRVVLLSDGDDEYALGRWNEAVDRWDILFSDHQFRRDFFTHWMPLLKISHP